MIVYRVCGASEAQAQIIDTPYRVPSSTQVMHSTMPGFHATKVPEHWRRILNRQMKERGQGQRYTHTLLLEISDDIQPTSNSPLQGEEYRLEDASQMIVRGIAGPAWPLPAWLPQPTREIDWEPTSTQWSTKVCKWKCLKGE